MSAVYAAPSDAIYVNGTGGSDTNNGTSWQWAKQSIKNATGTLNDNGTVNIADGTYSGVNNTNININNNMVIIGQSQNGTIINGTDSAQIFIIQSGVNVTIQNLTITNGKAPTVGNGCAGGAINNAGTLTITNTTFTNNQAGNGSNSEFIGGFGGSAGAISNSGTLNINNTTFTNNQAGRGGSGTYGGGSGGNGGAIYNTGTLTLTNTTITNNQAGTGGDSSYNAGGSGGSGGAIYNTGTLTLTNTTITNNQAGTGGAGGLSGYVGAGGSGGAIYNTGTLTLINTTIPNNQAGNAGSGDYGYTGGSGGAIYNTGSLNITNATFSRNKAGNGSYGVWEVGSGGSGGAIYNTGSLNITTVTFSSNQAGIGGSGGSGGGVYNQGGILSLNNTTFTQNNATNGGAIYFNGGTLNSITTTITQNNATNGGALYVNANMNLTSFILNNNTATNGGAIYNAATLNLTSCTLNNNTATNGGALWNNQGLINANSSTFTENKASEGGTIYNIGHGSSDAIVYLNNSTLTNNTATDNGGAIYNIHISSAAGNSIVNITNCTLTNNIATDNGGAIYNDPNTLGHTVIIITNSTLSSNTAKNLYGGAIYNYDSCTVNGSTLINNSARWGGAVYNNLAKLTITGSTLTLNFAFAGGAIYNQDHSATIITNSLISSNRALDGGAIYNFAINDEDYGYGKVNVTINNSTFTNNFAIDGGVLYNYASDAYLGGNSKAFLTVNGSTFTNNTATNGGVIYNYNDNACFATVDLNFNRIINNTATGFGYVIYNLGDTIDATLNWWGYNDPSLYFIAGIFGSASTKPWLVLNITASPTSIYYGGNSTVNSYILYDSYGNYHDPNDGCVPDAPVTFTSTLGNMDPTSTTLFNGEAQSLFTPNNIGTANITSTIDYQTVSTLMHIYTSSTDVTVADVDNFAGQNVTLTANVTDYYGNPVSEGQVTFDINHHAASVSASVINGVATTTWLIPGNWNVGTYTIRAAYSGGGTHYLDSNNFGSLTVDRTPTNANVTSVHDFAGQNVTLTATVKDYYNNSLNSGQVTFTVNGVNAGTVNVNSGGVATVTNWTIPSNWNAGIYIITANFHVTGTIYANSTGTGNLTVDQTPTNVTVGSVHNFAGQNVNLTVNVTDCYGNPLNVGSVKFIINGVIVGAPPLNNGITTVTNWQIPPNWNAGNYTIIADFIGTGTNYANSTGTGNLTVDQTPTNVSVNSVHNFAGQNVMLTAHIIDYFGHSVRNSGTVIFKVGSAAPVTVLVGSGSVSLIWTIPNNWDVGTYTITVVFNGTGTNYLNSTNSSILTADKIPTSVNVTSLHNFAGQNVTLTATVKDYYNGSVNGGKVYFTVNGVNTDTVDVNSGLGSLTWTIPNNWNTGTYIITANFNGTGTNYLNSTNSSILTVDRTPTNINVTSVHNFAGQNVTLTANVKDYYNNPFMGGTVIFTVNGATCSASVVSGVATLIWQIPNWNVENYIITAVFNGNGTNYANSTNSSILTVDRTPTSVNVTSLHNFAGQNVTLTANVKDYYNNPVSDGNVIFTIYGISIVKSVVDGVASLNWTIPLNMNAGEYLITAVFNGIGINYLDSTNSSTLTVDKVPTSLTVGNSSGFWHQYVDIMANLTDYYGNPLNGKVVLFSVAGDSNVYPVGTGLDGLATLHYHIVQDVGFYVLNAVFDGDFNYLLSKSNPNGTLAVDQTPTNVIVDAVHGITGQNVTLNATVMDYYNNPVSGGNVIFIVDGVDAGYVNVNNGAASLIWMIPSNWKGDYTILAVFNGTGTNYLNSSNSSVLSVEDINPIIVNIDPANGTVNVPVNKKIIVTFSKPVQMGSGFNNITVTNGSVNIPVISSISASGWLLYIKCASGAYGDGNYSVNIPFDAVADLAGSELLHNFTSNFSVNIPPTVANIDPANGTVVTSDIKKITVTFSEPIKAGSTFSSITVTNGSGTLIPVTVSFSASGWYMYVKINSGYFPDGNYTIFLPKGCVSDLAGNELANNYISNFSVAVPPTIANVDPANGTVVNSAINKVIVTFSEPVKAGSTFGNIAITIGSGSVPVTASFSASGWYMYIKINSGYFSNGNYNVNIPSNAVSDLAGNGLKDSFTSTFTVNKP